MKTLSVLSRKGGAGKTTVSVSLALAARQAGLRTVLADTDPMHSAGVVLQSRPDAPAFLFETQSAKLFVLQDACRRNGCDLLIVDTPTAPAVDVLRAINVSDFCLAVARPSALDVAAVRETVTMIERAGCEGLVVLNQCPSLRREREPAIVDQALGRLHFSTLPVASMRLRMRAAHQHAFYNGHGVTEWDPGSDATNDVLRLLAEIVDHMMLSPPRPLMSRRALRIPAEALSVQAAC